MGAGQSGGGAPQAVPEKLIMPVEDPGVKSTGSCPIKEGSAGEEKKKLKPCCACPETKKVRDECIMQEGEENCQHLIEAHKACMRSLGFNI
ncbi:unnamed protein product [Notodromas monacha]|uniref:Cytochrome c oxidase copper chaperone n=1 Tax=Notodromas monacha TaxID=399045 RepID=A0A7R9GG09_9CRUS|nr:unnamed protein product [Notodromas monacha]CAD7281195.1 unnamed protein product [Notodromas monacha]CAG0917012.1 unnamed protein product [Notodromas monacha]CAG0921347.1 unnamed protein product [Notodromas monacha]